MMRILAVLPIVALAACGSGGSAEEQLGEPIACGLDGAVALEQQCSVERAMLDGAQVFIVRHPDGGFHRFEVSADGQNLNAADGAEGTQSALKGDRWEVIQGAHRYVIPVKANVPQP